MLAKFNYYPLAKGDKVHTQYFQYCQHHLKDILPFFFQLYMPCKLLHQASHFAKFLCAFWFDAFTDRSAKSLDNQATQRASTFVQDIIAPTVELHAVCTPPHSRSIH